MATYDRSKNLFRAAPVVAKQIFIAADKPTIPQSYRLRDIGGFWLASDREIPVVAVKDADGRPFGFVVGHAFSEFHGGFLEDGEAAIAATVASPADVELSVLPRLSGLYVFITAGDLPRRVYMDHGASYPLLYSPADQRAATSVALLLEEQDYEDRFRPDLHKALVAQEGTGSWITGTLTAHRGVWRVLANHYLDLATWTTHRFWPKLGDFAEWRDFDASIELVAKAVTEFTEAASRSFKLAVALTAGQDTRLLVAAARTSLPDVEFVTLEAMGAYMDVDVSSRIARRFGLRHRVLPLHEANDEAAAIWDRMVGDCIIEGTRRMYTTVGDLHDRNAIMAGLFGETARCRLYRQDYATINDAKIDVRFIADRLTLPPHPELLDNMSAWLAELKGQPNSVIMEMAFIELKVGVWAMGQRAISNSIKLGFLPFSQRRVLEAFVGVEPAKKTTTALFQGVIRRLWPELMEFPINKYGDRRDYLTVFKKLSDPNKVRRYLRDRLARKKVTPAA